MNIRELRTRVSAFRPLPVAPVHGMPGRFVVEMSDVTSPFSMMESPRLEGPTHPSTGLNTGRTSRDEFPLLGQSEPSEPGPEPAAAEPAPPGEGEGTAVLDKPKPAKTKRKPKQMPPFKVLLHNDDVNSFDHVILTILKLTPLELEDAVVKTLEAHHKGLSLLLVTHKERAELYVEQFATYQLTVTIEADDA